MTLASTAQADHPKAHLIDVVRRHKDEDLSFDEFLRFAGQEIGASDLELRQDLWHLILDGELELTGDRTIRLPNQKNGM